MTAVEYFTFVREVGLPTFICIWLLYMFNVKVLPAILDYVKAAESMAESIKGNGLLMSALVNTQTEGMANMKNDHSNIMKGVDLMNREGAHRYEELKTLLEEIRHTADSAALDSSKAAADSQRTVMLTEQILQAMMSREKA